MKNEETNGEKKDELYEEILDFNKPDFIYIPKGNHDFRQKGYYLVCKSCDLEHATWIGGEKIMVGINSEGQPILKLRKELGIA